MQIVSEKEELFVQFLQKCKVTLGRCNVLLCSSSRAVNP